MKRLNGLEYSLVAIIIISLFASILTNGITIWVKIWLCSQGMFLIVVLSKSSEEVYREMKRADFIPGVIAVILDIFPWWVIKWGGTIVAVGIIILALFII